VKSLRLIAVSGAAAAIAVGAAACSSSSSSTAASAPTSSSPMASSSSSAMASSGTSTTDFGSGCASVPKSGAGSFTGMATAPVATAASANPVLSTLVTAVTKAGLVDTLNSASGITVFAPDNAAFAKIPTTTLSGGTYTVNGADVICGNVQTANATVYIISSVLMPK